MKMQSKSWSNTAHDQRRLVLWWLCLLVLVGMLLVDTGFGQEGERRPRRELTGVLRAATPWGCLIETELEGPTWVLFQEDAAGMPPVRELRAGLPEGLPRLPPVGFLPGLNEGVGAGIPLEFAVRVTTLVDAIPDGQRVRFRAVLDEERRRAVQPIRYLELVVGDAPTFGEEDDLEEAIPAFPGDELLEGIVVGRAYRTLNVMVDGRRWVIPHTANAVLRLVSSDPRFVALGDQVEIVGRERPDGLLVATRIRVDHREAAAMEALEELRAQAKLAAKASLEGTGEAETPGAVAVDPAGASSPIDSVAGGGTMEPPSGLSTEPSVTPVDRTGRVQRVFGRKVKLF